jgi:hypothetical protein
VGARFFGWVEKQATYRLNVHIGLLAGENLFCEGSGHLGTIIGTRSDYAWRNGNAGGATLDALRLR